MDRSADAIRRELGIFQAKHLAALLEEDFGGSVDHYLLDVRIGQQGNNGIQVRIETRE